MLVNLKEILELAERDGVALGAFNTPNLAMIRAAIEAAEELERPIILQHAQLHEPIFPLSVAAPVMLSLAEQAQVPICVHLDHGEDIDYIERGLKAGFTSVMFDGSGLTFEENKASTAKIVQLAAKTGASVEGEIGVVGEAEVGKESDIYTDPDDALDFVTATGIDALACAFGTVHGLYKKEPKLDFELVDTLCNTVNVPLVMHGGSGVSRDDYRQCINSGIRKINYFTYASRAGGEAVKEMLKNVDTPYLHEICEWGRESVKQDILMAIRMFSFLD